MTRIGPALPGDRPLNTTAGSLLPTEEMAACRAGVLVADPAKIPGHSQLQVNRSMQVRDKAPATIKAKSDSRLAFCPAGVARPVKRACRTGCRHSRGTGPAQGCLQRRGAELGANHPIKGRQTAPRLLQRKAFEVHLSQQIASATVRKRVISGCWLAA